jgi:hypothetical protein
MMSSGAGSNGTALSGKLCALLTAWLSADDSTIQVEDADVLLSGLPTDPPDSIGALGVAAAAIIEKQPEKAIQITLMLGGSGVIATRCLCAVVISQIGKYSPSIWIDLTKHLARDENWDVRNFAAAIFDSFPDREGLIEFHSDFVWETLKDFAKDTDYLIRRIPTRALLGFSKAKPEITGRLLELWKPLINDPTEYVRRNLVSALRVVGRRQPAEILAWMNLQLDSGKTHSGEIFRMVLETGIFDKNEEQKRSLLARLA